jgi:hypothetical protein
VVVVVVVIVIVMIHVVVVRALSSGFFELLTAFARLPAALAVALDRVAQLIFRLVNTLLTSAVSVSVIGPCLEGRAHQSGNSQQCNTNNSDDSSHGFSFKSGLYDFQRPKRSSAGWGYPRKIVRSPETKNWMPGAGLLLH